MVALALGAAMTGWTTVSAQGGIFTVDLPAAWNVRPRWQPPYDVMSANPFGGPPMVIEFVATSPETYAGAREAIFVTSFAYSPAAKIVFAELSQMDPATGSSFLLASGKAVQVRDNPLPFDRRHDGGPKVYTMTLQGNGRFYVAVVSFPLREKEGNDAVVRRILDSFKLGKAPRRVLGPD